MALLVLVLSLLAQPPAWASGGSGEPRVLTFGYGGVSRVHVLDADIYSIEVSGAPGDELRAEVHSPASTRVGIEHRRSGETVMIRAYRVSGRLGEPPWGLGPHRLVLRVPERCELELATDTGSILVTGVHGGKRLETDTGGITVRDCEGDATASTSTGAHTYAGIRGDLAARATTGGIRVADSEGALALTTKTGRIEALGIRLTGHSSFEAETGSITLQLAQSLEDFSFQLRSDTGRVSVGDTEARGRLSIGGGSIRLQAETSTGSVRIEGR